MDGLKTIQGRNVHTQQTTFIRVDLAAKDKETTININTQLPRGAIVIRAGIFTASGFTVAAGSEPKVNFVVDGENVLASGHVKAEVGHEQMTITNENAYLTDDKWISVVTDPFADDKGTAVAYIEFIQPR